MNQEFQERIQSLEAERLRPVPPVPSRTTIRPVDLQELVDLVAGPKPNWGKKSDSPSLSDDPSF